MAKITSQPFPALDLKFFQLRNQIKNKKNSGKQFYALNVFVKFCL